MTLPTPPPPVPDLREKVADYIRAHLLLSTAFVNRDYVLGHADKILALLPSPAVPDVLTWTREKPKVDGFYWLAAPETTKSCSIYEIRISPEGVPLWAIQIGPDESDRASWKWEPADATRWAGPLPEPRSPSPTEGEAK